MDPKDVKPISETRRHGPDPRLVLSVTAFTLSALVSACVTETPPLEGGDTTEPMPDAGIGDAGIDDSDSNQGTCGSGLYPGKSTQTLTAAGLSRTFILYVPENLDPSTPVPLVVVPHYLSGTSDEMYNMTQYADVAEREGFALAFPDGLVISQMQTWYIGEDVCGLPDIAPRTEEDVDKAFLTGGDGG